MAHMSPVPGVFDILRRDSAILRWDVNELRGGLLSGAIFLVRYSEIGFMGGDRPALGRFLRSRGDPARADRLGQACAQALDGQPIVWERLAILAVWRRS